MHRVSPSSLFPPAVRSALAVLLASLCVSGLHGSTQAPAAQAARLKIVVIAGEDAVNIIQQRTAVAPVVEVRDENDQPVAGVLVTFAVRAGRNARLAGNLRTVSITTDATGRAAVTSLTPTGNGVVQLDVTARFQGQTATTTISQTNFATAAQASAASSAGGTGATSGVGTGTGTGTGAGAGSGAGTGAGAGAGTGATVTTAGAAAGAGGGLSGIAIAGIAAAAGGGVAAASVLRSDSPSTPEAPIGPTSATYTGPATGQFSYVLAVTNLAGGAAAGGCTTLRGINGTVSMNLQVSGTTVTGTASTAGTVAVVSDNCALPASGGAWFPWQVTLNGTTSRFTGSASRPITFQVIGVGNAPGTETLTIEGSTSQGVVSAVVGITGNAQAQSATQNFVFTGLGTMPVSLR